MLNCDVKHEIAKIIWENCSIFQGVNTRRLIELTKNTSIFISFVVYFSLKQATSQHKKHLENEASGI